MYGPYASCYSSVFGVTQLIKAIRAGSDITFGNCRCVCDTYPTACEQERKKKIYCQEYRSSEPATTLFARGCDALDIATCSPNNPLPRIA